MSFPFGDGRHAPLAAEDQGRLIATILLDPGPHKGQTYRLHGPEEMDHYAIAEVMSGTLGRRVAYQPIEIDQWRKLLEFAGASPFLVQHLCAVALDYRQGLFAGEDITIGMVTGRAPMTLRSFLGAHRNKFA
jgi:NAD(P)H dehydrogenase (quinone)